MTRSSHRWLLGLAWRRARLPLCLSACEQILYALTPAAQAIALGALVGVIARPAPSWTDAWPWALLLLASYLAQQSFLLIPMLQHLYQQALEPALDEPVLRKASRLELSAFDDPAVHDLIARVGNPSGRAQEHIEDILRTAADWLQAIALAVVIARSVWWLGPAIIALSPLLPLLSARLGRRTHAFERSLSVTQREAGYAAALLTSRDAARELRLFHLAPHLRDRWRHHVRALDRARRRNDAEMIGRVFALNNLPQSALLFGGIVALGWGLSRHPADAGAFAAGLTALLALIRTVGFMNHTMRNLTAGGAYFGEVRQLLDFPDVQSTGSRPFPEPMRQGIRFAGVDFQYRGAAEPALSDISFELRPGERLALVGANGAGKSTLIKLLLGLYRPTTGRITVDGVDLAEFSQPSRSQALAAVFQDYAQFSLSARENIGFGQLDQLDDLAAIRRAARQAGAAEFVERLPDGYATPLGRLLEGSHEPSGGQWQRLALSRGLIRSAQLLILDEPTAALDPMAEAAVYRHFVELLAGRTAVLVTHRLGSARIADRILVLDQGRLVEQGSHEQLMSAGRLYSRMFAEQAAWYRSDGESTPLGRSS